MEDDVFYRHEALAANSSINSQSDLSIGGGLVILGNLTPPNRFSSALLPASNEALAGSRLRLSVANDKEWFDDFE